MSGGSAHPAGSQTRPTLPRHSTVVRGMTCLARTASPLGLEIDGPSAARLTYCECLEYNNS